MKITRDQMIISLIDDDIRLIRFSLTIDDFEFIEAILTGDGYIPYSKLSDDEIEIDYKERFGALDV